MSPVRRDPARPKVPELVPLIAAVLERSPAGCCLHVVTDDANWECAAWCLENADAGHADCLEALRLMVRMTESQISRATTRARTYRDADRCRRGVCPDWGDHYPGCHRLQT